MTSPAAHRADVTAALPDWSRVLVVVAHPDDESFSLGAVIDAFARQGAQVGVLCLTQGEATTLGDGTERVATRRRELEGATHTLGVVRTTELHHPDGALTRTRRHLLADDIIDEIGTVGPEGLLVFDTGGVTGHPDHVATTSAALLAAAVLDLPVLAWTLPRALTGQLNDELGTTFTGSPDEDIDFRVPVDRERQLEACRAHHSQAVPSSPMWRRLELLGGYEHLRWLRRAKGPVPVSRPRPAPTDGAEPDRVAHARHLGGDRFEITVRGHHVTVDQPHALGGDDTAPTPTEMFMASVAGCVAFYAHRFLARHDLPTRGFGVDVDYELGTKPSRVRRVEVRIVLPVGFPESRRDALLAVSSHCTVHNTLAQPPELSFTLADGASPDR